MLGRQLREGVPGDTHVNDLLTRGTTKTGFAVQDIPRHKLYPSISLKKQGEEILVNFGQEPFVYNIDDLMNVCIQT